MVFSFESVVVFLFFVIIYWVSSGPHVFQILFLQVVENILLSKLWIYFLFEATTNKICQFVGIPTWSRYTDSSWPIVVQVRQLVRKDLNFIWRPTGLVQNNVVRCRVNSSLTHRLADEVKIVPVVKMEKKLEWI